MSALESEKGPAAAEPGSMAEEIQDLPKEVGVMLVAAGIAGVLLPGPVGAPLLILGGVVLWPRAFHRAESCLRKRFPRLHHESLLVARRFLADLDRRYPLPK